MTWGGSQAQSKVRLNYGSLLRAIEAKGNRGYAGMVQCHGNAWARYDMHTKEIHLKLHSTDIITYHPNEERTLRAKGWHTPLTQHWFGQARINITSRKANDWSSKDWYYVTPSGTYYLFYDGMRIDPRGHLLSEIKPATKNVPNEEAKDLRKRITSVVGKVYMPHLRLLNGTDWIERLKQWDTSAPPDVMRHLINDEYDPLPTIAYALVGSRRYRAAQGEDAIHIFKKFVSAQYKQHVNRMQLFDILPYTPNER